MGQKLQPTRPNGKDNIVAYMFYCPGCDSHHMFYVDSKHYKIKWDFNGDVNNPTFSPSLVNTAPDHTDPKQRLCHLFMREGKIQYLGDCTHELAGQTIEMEDV